MNHIGLFNKFNIELNLFIILKRIPLNPYIS